MNKTYLYLCSTRLSKATSSTYILYVPQIVFIYISTFNFVLNVFNHSYVLILFSPNSTIHIYEGFLTLQHFKYTSKVLLFKLVMANKPDLLTTCVSEWFSLITHTYYLFSKVKILFLGCLLTWFNDFEICFVLLACLLGNRSILACTIRG